MQKIILIIILIFAFVGLAIYGYLQAIPEAENQSKSQPQIEATPNSFDFGEIEFGTVAKYVFKIKNSGNEILEIKKIATSCACTSAKVVKETLNSGEETELLVEYDTKLMGDTSHGKGEQERIIFIKSNDPVNPQIEVRIYANVQ